MWAHAGKVTIGTWLLDVLVVESESCDGRTDD